MARSIGSSASKPLSRARAWTAPETCTAVVPHTHHRLYCHSVLQWDIVKSVVKSVAGLQGRKFKVWLLSFGEGGRGALLGTEESHCTWLAHCSKYKAMLLGEGGVLQLASRAWRRRRHCNGGATARRKQQLSTAHFPAQLSAPHACSTSAANRPAHPPPFACESINRLNRLMQELLPEEFPGDEGEGGGRRKQGLLAQVRGLCG